MKAFSALLSLTLLIAPGGRAALCRICDCVTPGMPAQARDQAAAVIHVRVERVEDHLLAPSDTPPKSGGAELGVWLQRYSQQRHVQVRVLRVWKGNVSERATIFTSLGGGDCGYPFKPNAEYLVYAHKAPNGRLVAFICSRTSLISRAGDDLQALGPGNPPEALAVEPNARPHN